MAVVSSIATDSNASVVNPSGSNSVVSYPNNETSSSRFVNINSDLSALSIRATEYLQRWKEVIQFSSKDYSDQMAAQFGIKAPEYMGNHAHYIGGWSSVININEVVNTNLDTDSSHASIAGKGVSSYSGHEITYDWVHVADGWMYYNGDTGLPVRNDWVQVDSKRCFPVTIPKTV